MGFVFFLLLNAVLFVRPTEIVPDLQDARAYGILTLLCLLTSIMAVARQMSAGALTIRPITLCVVGLLPAIMLSHLARFSLWEARMGAYDFLNVLLYYLLLVATVTTASRLRVFLLCLTGLISLVAVLALLQYHAVIDLPALSAVEQPDLDPETGQLVIIPRLRGTGIFNDPNDLSLIIVIGILLCVYWLGSTPMGGLRFLWLGPLLIFVYALTATHSRGGLLALGLGLLVLLQARFGWSRAAALAAFVLPVLLVIFGGRQTRFDLGDRNDTAQERVQIWAEGLGFLRREPVFGIGYGQFAEECSHGLVAHNSYVHSFAELGLVGGTCFVGAFFVALLTLRRLGPPHAQPPGSELARLRPYLTAMLAAYMVGMFSLSRCYVIPTYLVVGLATAYLQATSAKSPLPPLKLDRRLVGQVALASAGCVAFLYVFVRTFAQFG
ncbi:MAG: O-antigen ligase family protein [Gemmataceae bacterium]|nr:O-antigen ligase family protein [Gemmataceae bacterium]